MKKKLMSVILSLALAVSSLLAAAPVQNVQAAAPAPSELYYNTGHRDTVAHSLSEAATSYYSDFAYDYADISSGSVTVTGEDLKVALNSLMQSTLTSKITYSSLLSYMAYTDAEDGTPGTVFFYSDMVDPAATPNREHVWPKSHASFYQLNGGADIHHLRPAVAEVNTQRGNYTMGEIDETTADFVVKHNGKEVGYIKNNLFEPLPNVKGDVARIFLYVYLCWSQPNLFYNVAVDNLPAFDSDDSANDGIRLIDGIETLLKWNYEDPVDTWELGRNDLGEMIQGNRNVFIDYPEYAWLIFGLEVPEGLVSPTSNNTVPGTYEPGDLSELYAESGNQIDKTAAVSIAEANAAGAGTVVTVKGQVLYRFGNNDSMTTAIIGDENGDVIQIYFGNDSFPYEVGDSLYVKGSIAEYHGVKQISSVVLQAAEDAESFAFTPAEVTVAELNADIDGYVSKIVTLKNVVLGASHVEDKTIDITQTVDGVTSSMVLYLPASYPEGIERGDTVDIVGVATKRDTDVQLRVGSSSDYTLVEKGEPWTPDYTTVEGIFEAADALLSGETFPQAVSLTGSVKSIKDAYNSQYNNISVYLQVGDRSILCYRLKGGDTLAVGDEITVTGMITNYNGTIEFVAGSTYTSSETVPVPSVDLTTESGILEAAFALEAGDALSSPVSLTGEITKIVTAYSAQYGNITVNMEVGGKTIQCYRLAGGESLAVGDVITVTGIIKNYKGTVEFDAGCTYVLKTTVPDGDDTTTPEPGKYFFEQITSVEELKDGRYILVTRSGDTFYAMEGKAAGDTRAAVTVSLDGKIINTTADSLIYTFTKTEQGYTIQDFEGLYFAFSTKNSGTCYVSKNLAEPTEYAYFSVVPDGKNEGAFTIQNIKNTRVITGYIKDGVVDSFRGYALTAVQRTPVYVYRLVDCEAEGHDLVFDGESIICRICKEETDAAVFTGYISTTEGAYVYLVNGALANGNVDVEGTEYYFVNGEKYTGDIVKESAAGTVIYTYEDGILTGRDGIEEIGEGQYIAFVSNEQIFGWQELNGNIYYFDPVTGLMAVGTARIDGVTYRFNEDGTHTEGTFVKNRLYTRYYFAGQLVKGFASIGEDTYHFDNNGFMVYGWNKIDGSYYFFDCNGKMATGTLKYQGVTYDLGEDGKLVSGTWVRFCGDYRYYYAGRYLTGWQEIDGNKYFFDIFGFRITGTVLMGNTVYTFDSNGVLTGTVDINKYTGYVNINGFPVYVKNGRIAPVIRLLLWF